MTPKELYGHYEGTRIGSSKELKEYLPREITSLIYGVEEQFRPAQSSNFSECWLFLGNCPQYQHNMTNALCTSLGADTKPKEAFTVLIIRVTSEELGNAIRPDVCDGC